VGLDALELAVALVTPLTVTSYLIKDTSTKFSSQLTNQIGRVDRGAEGGKGRDSERSYYVNTSPTGEDVITEEVIPKTKFNAPCFNRIRFGKCTNSECPYNHDFNIIDTRPTRRAESKENFPANEDTETTTRTTHHTGNVRFQAPSFDHNNKHNLSDEDEDGYDFDSNLGFSKANKTSSVSTCSIQAKFLSAFHMDWSFMHLFLLAQVFLSAVVSKSVSSTKYLLFFLALFLPAPKMLLERVLRTLTNQRFSCSAFAPFFCALYQIILDCGCTTTMSGDDGLFLPGALVKTDESVGMAEYGLSAKATHYGKLCLNGHLIETLFVPQFKQTMISLGQLERLSLKYKEVNNFSDLVALSGSIFLSFTLTNDNLYELNNRNLAQTNSSSSATFAVRAAHA
jgi:hypothetical protein